MVEKIEAAMMPYSSYNLFFPYLNEDINDEDLSLYELGLRDDAPPEAKKQYEEYIRITKKPNKDGVMPYY